MPHTLIPEHINERCFARVEGTLEGGDYLVWLFDVFRVDAHRFEHFIVSNVFDHIEWVGSALQQWHRFERRTPRAVVPEQRNDRDFVFGRGFHVHAADTKAAVSTDDNDLLAGPAKLHTYSHPDPVAYWSEGSSVDNLTGFVGGEPLARVSAQGKTIHD